MSQFSEVLSAYVKERDVNTYMLAKYCGYDRANMYKVLNGKRKVPNIGFVRKMAGYMHLSAREEERLLEEYCISVVGYENYYRRKSIQDFFENFSWRGFCGCLFHNEGGTGLESSRRADGCDHRNL